MAKQKRRKDGLLQKCITVKGKRCCIYAKTPEELDMKVAAKRVEIAAGIEKHDDPTLDEYFEQWQDARRGTVKESTIHTQNSQYKVCADVILSVGNRLGAMKMRDITTDDMREVQVALLKNGRRTQTVNDALAVISHIFNTAIIERRLASGYNPVKAVKPLKRTEERARDTHHRALTIEETEKFFEAAGNSHYLTVFKLAILTGMRCGEIGALMLKDISGDRINVDKTITRLESGAYVVGDSAKTKAGRRSIPMNDAIKAVFEEQKEFNAMLDGSNIISFNLPLFRAPERGLLMSTPVNREIKRICKRAGIEPFTLHAFRDTFATRAIERGVDIRTVQEILGHSDYSITANLYAHVLDNTLEAAMEKVSEIIAI
jgi:integrase